MLLSAAYSIAVEKTWLLLLSKIISERISNKYCLQPWKLPLHGKKPNKHQKHNHKKTTTVGISQWEWIDPGKVDRPAHKESTTLPPAEISRTQTRDLPRTVYFLHSSSKCAVG